MVDGQRWDDGNRDRIYFDFASRINLAVPPSPVRGSGQHFPHHPLGEPGFHHHLQLAPPAVLTPSPVSVRGHSSPTLWPRTGRLLTWVLRAGSGSRNPGWTVRPTLQALPASGLSRQYPLQIRLGPPPASSCPLGSSRSFKLQSLLASLSDDPTKFKEALKNERPFTAPSQGPCKGGAPTRDYSEIMKKPEALENAPHPHTEETDGQEPSRPPANDQEAAELQADTGV